MKIISFWLSLLSRFLFTMAKLTTAFTKPSRSASSRRTERREETPYSNRDSYASRGVQEHTRSLEHLAQSCPVCLSAGTSISVSASPPCFSGEGSSPLGKRKHESEDISDRKGKKKAKIEEESESEEESEREREEREEEERVRAREETVAFEEMLLARFSVDIPVGEAQQVPIDGPPPPTPPLSPLSRPLPHTPPPSPPHTPPPSPPRIVTARRPPLRRRETMI
ncbi:hypothetical protein BDF14DRAFT_1956003 [Spinellus fusiger]|nr:hypothetical protein BDF14DRAFT_1956003 [Spinellus fusiger]